MVLGFQLDGFLYVFQSVLVFLALFAAVCATIHFMHAPGNVAAYTTDVICSERL